MPIIDAEFHEQTENLPITDIALRQKILTSSKDFKTSWVSLGQALYTVWKDKMYKNWGYDTFDAYTSKEVGIKKQVAMKLLKTYYFLEKEEPDYLQKDYHQSRPPATVPDYDAINVLRLAKGKRELDQEDYADLKKGIFEKGKSAVAVRKDLTTMMKQREELDPEEERDKRNEAIIKRFLLAMRSFKKDAEVLKLIPGTLLRETNDLMQKLETQVSR